MKVKELIKLLQNQDPEILVVQSMDAEGNRFNETDSSFGRGGFKDGEIVDRGGKKCLILWPKD